MDLMFTPASFDNPDRRPDRISSEETRPTGPDLESQPVQWRKTIKREGAHLRDELAQVRGRFQIPKPKPQSSASRRSSTRKPSRGPKKSKPRSTRRVEPFESRIRTTSTQE
jgi:hypothetical protein